MSTKDVIQDIQVLFDLTCSEQLQSLNKNIVQFEPTDNEPVISNVYPARIDAASSDLKLTLLLRTPKKMLVQTLPPMNEIRPVASSLLQDWTLELSNRIIGHLKNKLVSYGCTLQNGLPCILGSKANLAFKHKGEEVALYFDLEGETIECRLFIELFNPNMTLKLQEHDTSKQGEIDFF